MMDQITIFKSLLENIGLITTLFVTFILVSNWNGKLPLIYWQVTLGVVFGVATIIAMFMGLELAPGVLCDLRVPILGLAGIFAGPVGAAVAATLPIIVRPFMGGAGIEAGIAAIIVVTTIGALYGHYLKKNNLEMTVCRLVIFSFAITPIGLSFVLLVPNQEGLREVFFHYFPILLFCGTLCCFLLGGLFILHTRQLKAYENLLLSEKRAENATKAKSEFLATVTHELRTPLFGIIGYAELLENSKLNSYQARYLKNIQQSGQILSQLINDLLDFEKLLSGKAELKTEALNLQETIAPALNSLQIQAELKNLALNIYYDREMPICVIANARSLNQILFNIIGNAIKFTETGHISLTVKPNEHQDSSNGFKVDFIIRDTGIGIEPSKFERIFESFTQETPETAISYGGTGLGLSICRQLVKTMGGSINVESEKDKGTTFFITLPFELCNSKDVSATVKNQKQALENEDFSNHILVAEDIPMNQELIKAMLTSRGYKTSIVSNGRDAVAFLEKHDDVDMVLLDIRMPVMGGLETASAIRQMENYKDMPVLALTANTSTEEIAKCFEVGIDDFLPKPVQTVELYEKLDHFLIGTSQELPPSFENQIEDHFDESLFMQYISFLGEDKMQETFLDFKEDTTMKLKDVVASGYDPELFGEHLHAVASMAGNIGLSGFSNLCRNALYSLSEDTAHQQSRKLYSEVKKEFDISCKIFKEKLDSIQDSQKTSRKF